MKRSLNTASVMIAALALLLVMDTLWPQPPVGTQLWLLLVGGALLQGSIGLVAITELCGAKWIRQLAPALLRLAPLQWTLPVLFLLCLRRLEYHSFMFALRQTAFLVLAALAASGLSRAIARESPRRPLWSGIYLLTFVAGQSFIAFDLVMRLDHPWVSTLFGGYFSVEALFCGIGLAALVASRQARPGAIGALRDSALLLFGFALFWTGLFYSQFLVIWYGNLPEEVIYFSRRAAVRGLTFVFWLDVALFLLLPFLLLLRRRAKESRIAVALAAGCVMIGLGAERVFMLRPHLVISYTAALAEAAILAVPFFLALSGGKSADPSRPSSTS